MAGKILRAGSFEGKPIFIAHGSQDEFIPLERAHEAARLLKENGAVIETCEAEFGHKISRQGIRGMKAFFSRMI